MRRPQGIGKRPVKSKRGTSLTKDVVKGFKGLKGGPSAVARKAKAAKARAKKTRGRTKAAQRKMGPMM